MKKFTHVVMVLAMLMAYACSTLPVALACDPDKCPPKGGDDMEMSMPAKPFLKDDSQELAKLDSDDGLVGGKPTCPPECDK